MKNLQPVFENHISFVEDNSNTFATPHSASTVITDESMYESYVQTLLDGYDSAAVNACTAVLNHQRRAILENFIPHIGGDAPVGWHLRSFPFLVDVYSEPIVAEICNVYPTDVPGFTVPRSRFKAITRSFDGLTVDSSYVPTATKNIKPGLLESKVSPDTITNIYTQLSLDNQHHLMNRRYTLMTSVRVREEDPVGTLLGEYSVPCSIQPHSRYGLDGEFEFNDVGSETVKAFTSGNVNFDKGTIQFHVNFTGGTGGNVYKCLYSVFNLGFVAKGTPNGRTELKMENDAKDIFIDPNEDFMINMTEEELQDWSAIYKINPMRSLSEVIKRQILLNKDWELSYFLKANEENMRKQGAKQYVNLDEYAALGGAGNYTPARVQDVLAAITPRISTLYSVIRRNFNMYPAYALAGIKTASHLRSLQEMVTNIPSLRGEMGFTGAVGQFMKLKVIEANNVDDNKIYLICKAPNNSLEKASIVDFIYQPFYVIDEVTDGINKRFARSRTLIDIFRTDGLGYLEVANMEKYVG